MAILTAYRALNMFEPKLFHGSLVSHDASHFTISDGVNSGTYYGTFTYSSVGLSGGKITGYDAYLNGVLIGTVRGGNVAVLKFSAYQQEEGANGANAYAFRLDDTMNGSAFADKIRGYSGSDIIN